MWTDSACTSSHNERISAQKSVIWAKEDGCRFMIPAHKLIQSVSIEQDYETLVSIMKCPNTYCNMYLYPPTAQCETGHTLCSACAKSSVCFMCNQSFIKTKNCILEIIAENLLVPCRNINAGCEYKCPRTRIAQHQKNCTYSKINCIEPNCEWCGDRDSFWDHMQQLHKELTSTESVTTFSVHLENPKIFDNQMIVQIFDCLFLVKVFYDRSLEIICGFVQLASYDKAEEFKYEFNLLYESHESVCSYDYCREVHLLKEQLSEIVENDECFKITIDAAKYLGGNECTATMTLKILQVH